MNTPKNPEEKSFEKKLSEMSPFEIKGTLIALAEADAKCCTQTFLNAGRGNPNWLLSFPRSAFFLLGQFAVAESERKQYDASIGIASSPTQAGIAERFEAFLDAHSAEIGAKVLRHIYVHATGDLKLDREGFVFELVDGILGDHYPTPPRILANTEVITREYLKWAMGGDAIEDTPYDLFATEGSTAGMCYLFESLKQNFLLNEGDKLALLTPCFTPYLEIPTLEEFGYEVVKVSANAVEKNGYHDWQYPKEELDKLRDKSIKAVCITNPSNPPSYTFSDEVMQELVDIVNTSNPDLMIVTDDVYGTFQPNFKSLMYVLPQNTLCLYSYSKYFGATGWRLAAMALAPNNVFDRRLKALPEEQKRALRKRYSSLSMQPDSIKFIDRLVADSRLVALNHTAGLSTPQQIQMLLFSAFAYLHREQLQPRLINLIHNRLEALWSTTGFTLIPDPNRVGYYSEIDIMVWAKKIYGDDFAKWLNDNYEPLDFVVRLANETAIVLLNGDGFDGPKWSIRTSLANLDRDAYLRIGTCIRQILDDYHTAYKK